MRIVQSFWSGDKDILQNDFGWCSAQHHLMAWALSCLKLKTYYDDVHLYTDTNGYKILIEQLGLPYTQVEICYDNIPYNDLWVLPKILTYAAQQEPFIHVDGDVFIWEKFPVEMENASLLAQNFEIGTAYYENALKHIENDLSYLPDFLRESLRKNPIPSYNAGVLGGSDLAFFKEYAQTALDMIHRNYDKSRAVHSGIYNILCEQILFASIAARDQKEVACYFKEQYKDNGYSAMDIADLSSIGYRLKYIHLLGPHKRSRENCELMSRFLYKEYPEYFAKVVSLFSHEHRYFTTKIKEVFPTLAAVTGSGKSTGILYPRTSYAISLAEKSNEKLPAAQIEEYVTHTSRSVVKEIFTYETDLLKLIAGWNALPASQLYSIENSCPVNSAFFFLPKEAQLSTVIEKNNLLTIIETPFDWTSGLSGIAESDPDPELTFNIACAPELFFNGFSERSIDDLEYNILALLDSAVPLAALLKALEACFSADEIENDHDSIYELVLMKLKRLSLKKFVFIKEACLEI